MEIGTTLEEKCEAQSTRTRDAERAFIEAAALHTRRRTVANTQNRPPRQTKIGSGTQCYRRLAIKPKRLNKHEEDNAGVREKGAERL